VRSSNRAVLIAIRENEEARSCWALTATVTSSWLSSSPAMSAASGAAYALLFSYVGSTFASIQYSILPLALDALGGVGTTLWTADRHGIAVLLDDFTSGYTRQLLLLVRPGAGADCPALSTRAFSGRSARSGTLDDQQQVAARITAGEIDQVDINAVDQRSKRRAHAASSVQSSGRIEYWIDAKVEPT